MGIICDISDGWEYYIARAELEYNQNKTNDALLDAQMAKKYANTPARQTAIGIFIAKCYSALGDYEKSSHTYRDLISAGTYLPPVIMGMMYNNLKQQKTDKVKNNLTLVKVFTDEDD
jgi:hypothetical protein